MMPEPLRAYRARRRRLLLMSTGVFGGITRADGGGCGIMGSPEYWERRLRRTTAGMLRDLRAALSTAPRTPTENDHE